MRRPAPVLFAAGVLLAVGAPPLPGQTILGRVVDERSHAPLGGAAVTLLDSVGAAVQSVVADGDGRFRVTVRPASYAFAVRRLGYAPFTTARLTVAPDAGAVNVTIAVPVREVVLDPVTVEGEAVPFAPGPLADFEARRARGLGGVFLTYEDIRIRSPTRATDVFYGLPGVKVSKVGRQFMVRMRGKSPLGQAGRARNPYIDPGEPPPLPCPPTLYIDGVRVMHVDQTLTEMVGSELYGVEVYRRASETPAEFLDSDSYCGVIVIWTKRAPAGGQS